MECIVIRYLTGPKARQIERFPLDYFTEIIIGREPTADVKFIDDVVVGRQHARINQDPSNPSQFFIQDLNSRNGTFVNGQRLIDQIPLRRGDIIQFGANGPYLQFYLEPGTEPLLPDLPVPAESLPHPVQRITVPISSFSSLNSSDEPLPNLEPVPRQELTARTNKSSILRLIGVGGVLLGITAGIVAGAIYYRNSRLKSQMQSQRPDASPQQPAQLNANAAASIDPNIKPPGSEPVGTTALPAPRRVAKPPAKAPAKAVNTKAKTSKKTKAKDSDAAKAAEKAAKKRKKEQEKKKRDKY